MKNEALKKSELLDAAKNGETAKLLAQMTEVDRKYEALGAEYVKATESCRRDQAGRERAEKGQEESEEKVKTLERKVSDLVVRLRLAEEAVPTEGVPTG